MAAKRQAKRAAPRSKEHEAAHTPPEGMAEPIEFEQWADADADEQFARDMARRNSEKPRVSDTDKK